MSEPASPQSVRFIYQDGTETGPLPLVYVGVEDDLHVWEVCAPNGRIPHAVRMAVLPARTTVRVAIP